MEPDVAVTIIADVPEGVPPVAGLFAFAGCGLFPVLPHPRQAISNTVIRTRLGFNRRPPTLANPNEPNTIAANANGQSVFCPSNGTLGNPLPRAVVATVTTICAGALPLRLSDAGLIAHVVPLGAPLHVAATVPVNEVGDTVTVYVAV